MATLSKVGRCCLRSFNDLLSGLEYGSAIHEAQEVRSLLSDDFARFKIWAGNIGALQEPTNPVSLDYRLGEACDIAKVILGALETLQQSLEQIYLIHIGKESDYRFDVTETELELRKALNGEGEEEEEENANDEGDYGNLTDILEAMHKNFGRSRLQDLLDSVFNSVAGLLTSSILIRSTTSRDRYARALTSTNNPFNEEFDISHVANKFPKLSRDQDNWLLQRLGKAITHRRQLLQYYREHHEKLAIPNELSGAEENPQAAPSLQRTVASTLDASAVRMAAQNLDETMSTMTYGSFATFAGGLEDPASLQVPPSNHAYGSLFECPYCWQLISIPNEAHVFQDLKSYVCTFESCNLKLFPTRKSWFEHEMREHRSQWQCTLCTVTSFSNASSLREHIQVSHDYKLSDDQLSSLVEASRQPLNGLLEKVCPFCDSWGEKQEGKRPANNDNAVYTSPIEYRRHVSRHMEQLALFALPRNIEDTDEDEFQAEARSESNPSLGSTLSLNFDVEVPKEFLEEASPSKEANFSGSSSEDDDSQSKSLHITGEIKDTIWVNGPLSAELKVYDPTNKSYHNVTAVLDTGGAANWISEGFRKKIGSQSTPLNELDKQRGWLALDGREINPQEKIRLHITSDHFGSGWRDIEFYILESLARDMVLGSEIIEKERLLDKKMSSK